MSSDYVITVKLPKNPAHNPAQKIPGQCPVFGTYCTDVTGAHHSSLVRGWSSAASVQHHFEAMGFHVTRVERVTAGEG